MEEDQVSSSRLVEDKPEILRNLAVCSSDWRLSGWIDTLPVYMNSART